MAKPDDMPLESWQFPYGLKSKAEKRKAKKEKA